MNLQTVINDLRKGGFTYSLSTGDCSGTPFYSVGYSKEIEVTLPESVSDVIAFAVLKEYIEKHSELLAQEDIVLGGWLDGGLIYFDIAQLISKEYSIAYVIGLAKERNQLAVYDLEAGETIETFRLTEEA